MYFIRRNRTWRTALPAHIRQEKSKPTILFCCFMSLQRIIPNNFPCIYLGWIKEACSLRNDLQWLGQGTRFYRAYSNTSIVALVEHAWINKKEPIRNASTWLFNSDVVLRRFVYSPVFPYSPLWITRLTFYRVVVRTFRSSTICAINMTEKTITEWLPRIRHSGEGSYVILNGTRHRLNFWQYSEFTIAETSHGYCGPTGVCRNTEEQ